MATGLAGHFVAMAGNNAWANHRLLSACEALTAEEFARQFGGDHVELIDGEVKELPMAMFPHGVISSRFDRCLGNFVADC